PNCNHTFHRHRKPPSVPCWCHHCGPDLGALRFRDTKTGRLTRVRRPRLDPPPPLPTPTAPPPSTSTPKAPSFAGLPLFASLFRRP
ncbi:MAG: hypothetical protein AAF078_14310, partial [Planctomycetota bacterium]